MHWNKGVIAILVIFTLALSTSLAGATEERIPLKGSIWERVRGEAVINDTGITEGEKQLTIDVSGLKPNSVYTVWLAKDRPARDFIGAGPPDHFFKTDGSGNGRYVVTLSGYSIQGWDKLEVALHPDGDPQNLRNSVIALSADLPGERRR